MDSGLKLRQLFADAIGSCARTDSFERDNFGDPDFRRVATRWVGQRPAAATSIDQNMNPAARCPWNGPAVSKDTSL